MHFVSIGIVAGATRLGCALRVSAERWTINAEWDLASGKLTTHVLDTANGRPAGGLTFTLSLLTDTGPKPIKTLVTNSDGRCDAPLLEGDDLQPGWYEIGFDVGAYFATLGQAEHTAFLGLVPIRFQVTDPKTHYHVPLLVAPYGYSTYRGS